MVKKVCFILFIILPVYAFSQGSPENKNTSPKEYQFAIKGDSKKTPAKATLKLSEKHDVVYLYFEGSDLQAGKYLILKTKSCANLTKQMRSKTLLEDENELYSFETKYGDISGERNLPFKNFQELDLEQISFALIKIERKNKIILSCVQ